MSEPRNKRYKRKRIKFSDVFSDSSSDENGGLPPETANLSKLASTGRAETATNVQQEEQGSTSSFVACPGRSMQEERINLPDPYQCSHHPSTTPNARKV